MTEITNVDGSASFKGLGPKEVSVLRSQVMHVVEAATLSGQEHGISC